LSNGVDVVKNFLEKRGVRVQFLEFEISTETVLQAAEAVGVEPSSILKTLLMKADDKLVIAMVCGLKRIDYNKMKKILKVKKIRFLYPDEVEKYTPFEIGGVSPFFEEVFKFKIVLDNECLNNKEVILGGGDSFHLIKIDVTSLLDIFNPLIADISK
jgi:Cys-tRNA(Pro)/Cys-tRNA(Cys) deacylase